MLSLHCCNSFMTTTLQCYQLPVTSTCNYDMYKIFYKPHESIECTNHESSILQASVNYPSNPLYDGCTYVHISFI